MSANVLIKVMLGVVLAAAVMLGITQCAKNDARSLLDEEPAVAGGEPLDEATQAALGIEADTPEDSVRTLIANVREQKRLIEDLRADNAQLRDDNQQLARMEDSLLDRLRAELGERGQRLREESRDQHNRNRAEVLALLDRVRARQQSDQRVSERPPLSAGHVAADASGTVWLEPLGSQDSGGGLIQAASTRLASLSGREPGPPGETPGAGSLSRLRSDLRDEVAITPAYTIPKNSTLVGATAFTALIGRVPVGDNVTDPYTFKALIGRDNLIANGAEVPEFAYAVVSGKAIGDWTLGCVAGDVHSMTFVFADGRVVTLPEPESVTDGASTTREIKIGELADAIGNPCVPGERVSNAGSYLAQRVAAVAASAAARAAAAAETTSTFGAFEGVGGFGFGGTTQVTGDRGRFILDQTLAGGAAEAAQWVRDRQAAEFDAVYVRAGADVAIHVTEELRIDYDEVGRLTHHPGFARAGVFRELD